MHTACAQVLDLAMKMKARPADYWDALKRRTLLMLFEKPSLRTRVSLEAGMTQLGGARRRGWLSSARVEP